MDRLNDELQELLTRLKDHQQETSYTAFQELYLRFRGLVQKAAEHNSDFKKWEQRYLPDESDESGEVVKLHESVEELRADIEAFKKRVKMIAG